jgi:hypothetical protein
MVTWNPEEGGKYHEDEEQDYNFRDQNVCVNDLRSIIMIGFGISESC